jgi:hypothetical protein
MSHRPSALLAALVLAACAPELVDRRRSLELCSIVASADFGSRVAVVSRGGPTGTFGHERATFRVESVVLPQAAARRAGEPAIPPAADVLKTLAVGDTFTADVTSAALDTAADPNGAYLFLAWSPGTGRFSDVFNQSFFWRTPAARYENGWTYDAPFTFDEAFLFDEVARVTNQQLRSTCASDRPPGAG